jgi:hypothetical protein
MILMIVLSQSSIKNHNLFQKMLTYFSIDVEIDVYGIIYHSS